MEKCSNAEMMHSSVDFLVCLLAGIWPELAAAFGGATETLDGIRVDFLRTIPSRVVVKS